MVGTSSKLPNGTILGDRYKIIKQIGQGGFGRTYLAEDSHRYQEQCVLKEFAPLVESDTDQKKAEELFEREAGILYRLQHDRIPQFKALLRTQVDRKRFLFLVQEYVAGETYYDLLQKGEKFGELEIINLLNEILPVLAYIHQENLIHRDISPDNLICRQVDRKPVLIDFGCVKLAANAVSRSQGYLVTLIGKKGYAPEEQMRSGSAFPSSDLYGLAATAIVLLTGKSPNSLYDAHQGKWQWEQEVNVSSHLAKVLNKMLAYNPRDRYQTALEVAQVLSSNRPSLVDVYISRIKTLIVAPKHRFSAENKAEHSYIEKEPTHRNTLQINPQITSKLKQNISRIKTQTIAKSQIISRQVSQLPVVRHIRPWQWVTIAIAAAILPGMITFSAIQNLGKITSFFYVPVQISTIKERNQQQKIYQRVQALNIDSGSFFAQVDREFYRQYPEMKGVTLTNTTEHRRYRRFWYQIAENLLRQKENSKNFR